MRAKKRVTIDARRDCQPAMVLTTSEEKKYGEERKENEEKKKEEKKIKKEENVEKKKQGSRI